jgi:hypothetical protein
MIESALVRFPQREPSPFAGVSVNLNDHPLYSQQSRAAARLLVEQRQREYERRELILCYRREAIREPRASKWTENAKERRTFRMISVPEGMTLAEALRAIGGYSQAALDRVAELNPEPLVLGSMLMLRR